MSPSAPGTSTVHGAAAGLTFSPASTRSTVPAMNVGDGVDALRGQVHAVVLEPGRRAVRVRRPVGDLQVVVGRRRGGEELLVVLAERVDARLLLRVGVVDVGTRAQAEPDDVVDALVARLVDDRRRSPRRSSDRIVVPGHDDQHLTEFAVEVRIAAITFADR